MEDFLFFKVVQLNLTAYLEWVVALWMLKQCTKKDDLQENTGLGSGEMCWLCLTHDFGTSIKLVTNMDELVPHLQEIVKNAGKHYFWIHLKTSIDFSFVCSHCCWSGIDLNKGHTGAVVYIKILFWNMRVLKWQGGKQRKTKVNCICR